MIWILLLLMCLAACNDDPTATPSPPTPTPFGVLTIRLNGFGGVEFETSTGFSTPVPLESPAGTKSYLTLRLNGQDFYYSLNGQSFNIQFESEDYTAVNGRKTGENYFLEVVPLSTPFAQPADCPGAPPTQFTVGETVQVDFNSVGALKIRTDPFTERSIMQVYDNARLQLMEGPVCGIDRWVWKVYYAPQDVTGWASEGIVGDPWMCPLSNPECGN
jgi:hypothetical protein